MTDLLLLITDRLFLQIMNSCDNNVVMKKGIPVTNKSGHGIGVNSICAIVERYGGIYSFLVKDCQFILRVSLSALEIL